MYYIGATSIEKSPKISAFGQNFLDSLSPSSKKGPTDKNVSILYLIVILKLGFLKIPPPSPNSSESRFYQLRWLLTPSMILCLTQCYPLKCVPPLLSSVFMLRIVGPNTATKVASATIFPFIVNNCPRFVYN